MESVLKTVALDITQRAKGSCIYKHRYVFTVRGRLSADGLRRGMPHIDCFNTATHTYCCYHSYDFLIVMLQLITYI
jgi:hypothetical protein